MIDKEELLNNKDFYKSFKSGEDLTSFFKELHKKAVEHMLGAELDSHLDNTKHEKTTNGNYRNGYGTNYIKSSFCESNIKVAKDHEDSFYPALVLKRHNIIDGLENVIISFYTKSISVSISPAGVRRIWLRHGLHTFKLRLKALESKSAQEGIVLTESQLSALERAKEEKKAHGEIETHHPGYLGAQDTYYVGNIKGVGHVYQQTFIDTYSKVAFAKLYDRKNALIAADMLNDQVVPFFEQQDLRLLRILTDRGTEYCGIRDQHEYQLYLAIEDIDHTKTKAKSPQTNGICERFHRTIQDEFYAIAFRKKIYRSIEELQLDLNNWLLYYNTERTHTGKHCYGKTPMQTFLNSKPMAREKLLETLAEDQKIL